MPDYKTMYTELFQVQTKVISLLQEAHLKVEEMYIDANPPEIKAFPLTAAAVSDAQDKKVE